MKFFRRFLVLVLLFIAYTFICAISYTNAVSSSLSDSVFRLHILANSDSEEDQNLKLLVRDNVLNYMKEISSDCSSKQDVISLMDEHLIVFEKIAKDTIKDAGYNYDVKLQIRQF